MPTNVPVDASDPIVALLAWFFTWSLLRLFPDQPKRKIRKHAPTIAFFTALFLRTVVSHWMGAEESGSTEFLRALAAGAVAVFMHSQIREIQKSTAREAT